MQPMDVKLGLWLVMDSGQIVLSAIQPETVAHRIVQHEVDEDTVEA